MSYQYTIDILRQNLDDDFPASYFHNLVEVDYDHEGFTSIQCPYTGFVDYIRELDDTIIVISDSDQWCDGPEDDGWTYAIFMSIDDYVRDCLEGACNPIISDFGYTTFNDCFKSAVFDMLQNLGKFRRY